MSVPSAVVCLPTYNERENLEKMVRALGDKGVNVLVVDDNSPDGTGEIADRLATELDYVSVLHREKKEGIGRAYIAAFELLLRESAAELILDTRKGRRTDGIGTADPDRALGLPVSLHSRVSSGGLRAAACE